MTDITELALIAKIKKQLENFDTVVLKEGEAVSLVEALERKEEQRANWFQMAQKLGEDLDAAEKRIAELESRTVKLPATRLWAGVTECYEKYDVIAAIRAAGVEVSDD
ncbi:hypothetical protein [Klebsiella quasipneumoniae]|uniref:hypothetical protein n=1 Tax=Klebsiella quasipneumoniae TaxID=1463165 RepID=UPI000E489DED|nr:hypothetical protein [Klebsiella quasipneumoniae]MBC4168721.1 hypothetical protein [Klebsiella quasipneumoniae]MBX8479367.1 hypothetical protein [Klebsiella quasipneumoniae subsp. similipneumoniae]MBX9411493.1 hypothetical protein [Klebsiella quasipneumoniae subsp. similipneumoniae]MBX9417716.1 hypothetical protein [Klebsiella quasipneumoniae subsp. similipneumoniae]HBT4704263.1 hypothetical protein [Klebsiella quasipneumoniae subsp. similipneumoniae]